MEVDYSKFEHPHDWDNWFGKVCIKDGTSEKCIKVEIQTEEDFIPDESKKMLDFFVDNYSKYEDVLLEAIFEYYNDRRSAWGNPPADDPLYPEVTDRNKLSEMYTLKSIVIHDPDESDNDSIGLLYDCTWDDEGIGIKMLGLTVVEIEIQGTQY